MTFTDALLAAGLFPRDVIADGKWHRCPTRDKPKKKNGAFLLTLDGRRGWFKNFALDLDFHVWSDGKPVTEAQQRDYDRQMREALAAERARQALVVAAMRAEWAALPPLVGLHPYIEAKGLTANGCAGLKVRGVDLVVPMRIGTTLLSFQTITPAGEKRFRTGCPISGSYHLLHRPNAAVTAFAEGLATGLAIFQAVPTAQVVVCFDAGNLVKVATSWSGRGLTVICADDDHGNAVNTGLIKGMQAAELLGCGVAAPEGIEGTDWADALAEGMPPARIAIEVMRHARYRTGAAHQ